ncbi:MAG: hypothetical protein ACE5KM_22490 [Planctomycetaceae bacterium]
MRDAVIAIATGFTLVSVGGMLMRWHRRSWHHQKNDASLEADERRFLHSQFRRRMQASGILALLGVLIPVGVLVIPWRQFPGWISLFWIAVLLLTFWVIVLGLADAWTTSVHSRAALARIRRRQRDLEAKAAQLRRQRANGRDPDGESD